MLRARLHHRSWLALAFTAALAGCGGGRDYPSLALRPMERQAPSLPAAGPAELAPATAADPQLLRRLAGLDAAAAAAHARFLDELPRVQASAVAARTAGPGSDAWSEAIVALSRLTAIRAPVGAALAALDELAAEGAETLAPADASALAATRTRVETLSASEDDDLVPLRNATGG